VSVPHPRRVFSSCGSGGIARQQEEKPLHFHFLPLIENQPKNTCANSPRQPQNLPSDCVTSPALAPLLKSPHKFKQNKDLFRTAILAKTPVKPLK
jgi:hypothetical protein